MNCNLFFFCKGFECIILLMIIYGMIVLMLILLEVMLLLLVEMIFSYCLFIFFFFVYYMVILCLDLYLKVVVDFFILGYVKILINCIEEINNIIFYINKIMYDNLIIKVFYVDGNLVNINMVIENK